MTILAYNEIGFNLGESGLIPSDSDSRIQIDIKGMKGKRMKSGGDPRLLSSPMLSLKSMPSSC